MLSYAAHGIGPWVFSADFPSAAIRTERGLRSILLKSVLQWSFAGKLEQALPIL